MSMQAERPHLIVPGRPFDGFVEQTRRVSPTCLIQFEGNRYSVPASFANRPVSLRVYPDRLRIIAEGQVLCVHDRIITRSHVIERIFRHQAANHDNEYMMIDSTIVRARQHSAGTRKKGHRSGHRTVPRRTARKILRSALRFSATLR